jgi:pimeloyl-ACP methyl ester carboxylesterase
MSTNMARRWAQLGFDVLRIDVPGIGDTPVAPGTTENLTYPPSGLDDLRQTVRTLAPRQVIVAGLCSGGDYAFQLGASEPAVTGAWILNPHTFCVLDLDSVVSGSPATAPVDDVPTMLRRIADLRGDALLLVSRNDPGIAYIDAHAAEAMRNLSSVVGFRRIDLDGSDHTFTPVSSQRRVSDILTAHLAERYGRLRA